MSVETKPQPDLSSIIENAPGTYLEVPKPNHLYSDPQSLSSSMATSFNDQQQEDAHSKQDSIGECRLSVSQSTEEKINPKHILVVSKRNDSIHDAVVQANTEGNIRASTSSEYTNEVKIQITSEVEDTGLFQTEDHDGQPFSSDLLNGDSQTDKVKHIHGLVDITRVKTANKVFTPAKSDTRHHGQVQHDQHPLMDHQYQKKQPKKVPNCNPAFNRKFYNVPDSDRLNGRWVNQHSIDTNAAVGSYTPFPLLWENASQVRRKQTVKDVWARTSDRFVVKDSKLSPGIYEPHLCIQTNPAGAVSAFKSSQERFRMRATGSNVAPGSYNTEIKKVQHGFTPWIKSVHGDLARIMEPPESVSWGTSSHLLTNLSSKCVLPPKSINVDKKQKNKPPATEVKETAGSAGPAKPLHPFSLTYLVTKPVLLTGNATPNLNSASRISSTMPSNMTV
ncbi:hypothetical protein O5D80_008120 [Batrachochytrium dendrobatidis]|nr:hypothetical protein O5D80_008120 [Batrachochytrium dendrobatidis]